MDGSLLVLRPDVVIVEWVVSDRVSARITLPDGGNPDSRESAEAYRVGLFCQVIIPIFGGAPAGRDRGNVPVKALHQDVGLRLAICARQCEQVQSLSELLLLQQVLLLEPVLLLLV